VEPSPNCRISQRQTAGTVKQGRAAVVVVTGLARKLKCACLLDKRLKLRTESIKVLIS
jgi:hypothetical protein